MLRPLYVNLGLKYQQIHKYPLRVLTDAVDVNIRLIRTIAYYAIFTILLLRSQLVDALRLPSRLLARQALFYFVEELLYAF